MTPAVVHRPTSIPAAARLVTEGAVPLAGGTWVMRGSLAAPEYVALCCLPDLRGVRGGRANGNGGRWAVGAMTTHTDLARWAAPPALAALRGAAAESAFPQVRNVATIGGNICAAGFAEADLVPALLALAARVHRMRAGREETVGLAEHIATRLPGTLVLAAELDVPPADVRSGFARLTVRGGGEYAVCSVALAVRRDDRGSVTSARIAVGSVETMARRCPDAEAALVGAPLTAESARTAGTVAASTLVPRDGHDAPGWYRTAVLPTLLQRAAARAVGEETR